MKLVPYSIYLLIYKKKLSLRTILQQSTSINKVIVDMGSWCFIGLESEFLQFQIDSLALNHCAFYKLDYGPDLKYLTVDFIKHYNILNRNNLLKQLFLFIYRGLYE